MATTEDAAKRITRRRDTVAVSHWHDVTSPLIRADGNAEASQHRWAQLHLSCLANFRPVQLNLLPFMAGNDQGVSLFPRQVTNLWPDENRLGRMLLAAVVTAASGLKRADQDEEAEHRRQGGKRLNKRRHAVAERAAGQNRKHQNGNGRPDHHAHLHEREILTMIFLNRTCTAHIVFLRLGLAESTRSAEFAVSSGLR